MKEVSVLCLTYGKLCKLVSCASKGLEKEAIHIVALEGLSENIADQVEREIIAGVDVIVAGGANAAFAKRRFDIPVVEIRVSAYDYVQAIHHAGTLGRHIVIVMLEGAREFPFATMSEMLGSNVKVVTYCTSDNLEQCISSSGADVVIGASHAAEIAEQMGLASVLIYPGEETITEAILEANKLVKEMRRERARNELTDALIRCTPNSIVITNDAGEIIEFNAEAEKAYGKSALSVKGRPADEVLSGCSLVRLLAQERDQAPAIRNLRERMYLDKSIQITQENRVTGAIEILTELSDIRHAEHRYNVEQEKKNQIKGFHAKTRFQNIVGESTTLRELVEEAKLFSKTDASILVYGETGTGKELFAQSIHNHGTRCNGPFIAINCAALPESLLESELFGYEEGAFTGSKKGGKMGIFELANGGTIFLDEIGELCLSIQARLLRVLQEKEVMRIGGERIFKIDVRVICATNKDIYHMGDKEFRRDLLYRLKVLELNLPPLRQREYDYDPARHGENQAILPRLVARLKLCFQYNNEQVASALGLSRTTLWRLEK